MIDTAKVLIDTVKVPILKYFFSQHFRDVDQHFRGVDQHFRGVDLYII